MTENEKVLKLFYWWFREVEHHENWSDEQITLSQLNEETFDNFIEWISKTLKC